MRRLNAAIASTNPEDIAAVTRCVKWVMRVCAVLFAIAETIVARNVTNPDTLGYLDVARAYLSRDWPMTVNAYWQPLYSWLLLAVIGVTRPSLRWEIPAIHFLNLAIFLVCLGAFEYFWTGLSKKVSNAGNDHPALPAFVTWILGYALFTWLWIAHLLPHPKPDLLVATMAFVQAGLITRLLMEDCSSTKRSVLLGAALGVGYLCKAILFPMALVSIGLLAVSLKSRKHIGHIFLVIIVFVAISAPEIILLSRAKGRFTFADTGKLAYAWLTYKIPDRNWQGLPPGSGTPVHATRQIYSSPPVYEYNGPIRATYPPWFDPSYWNEGMAPRFSFARVWANTRRNATLILLFFTMPKIWLAGMAVLFACASLTSTLKGILAGWHAAALGTVALSFYSLTFVEPRYVVGWMFLIWSPLLLGIRLRAPHPKVWFSFSVIMALGLFLGIGSGIYWQVVQGRNDDGSVDYQIAEGLKKLHVDSGEKVATIGFSHQVTWAYLDRLRVVAEIGAPGACDFWHSRAQVQSEIMDKFRESGAAMVVVNSGSGLSLGTGIIKNNKPYIDLGACALPGPGWQPIEGTKDYVYFLSQRNP
jgi:hypothetical protein